MHDRTAVLLVALLLAGTEARSQASAEPNTRKEARATLITGRAPVVDGRLDEEVWSGATPIADFIQKQPNEGSAPTERTEVFFLYDEDALYVGARMHSHDPSAIQAPVSRRDNGHQAEHLLVSLDTYLDRRTAYTFGVTASGVRLDWYHPEDNEHSTDLSFDPVWEARARIDSLGWTAELRIPFSQLRFNEKADQVWGLNLDRWIPSRNEDVFWVPVPTNVQAWASRFGHLTGIEGIRPTRRIELLPYLASDATLRANPDPNDPFAERRETAGRVGADLKMGLGPSLTLEATVNPDFGQVEADPAEVNLSAFETFFEEKRPFFTEGRLPKGQSPPYFYSRRIGAPPPGRVDADYADYPGSSTILGAAKLAGRLASGTSIGVLAAVTDEESARTFDEASDLLDEARVAPRTAWGVASLQQEFGRDASTAGFMLTAVRRDLEAGEPLAAQMTHQAFAGAANWNLRFIRGTYAVRGHIGFTRVEGEPAAIFRLQRSPVRYFQRPDAAHVEVDPARTSLTGLSASAIAGKYSGRWLWQVVSALESPAHEYNDLGSQSEADFIWGTASLTYRETQPGPVLRNYSVRLSSENGWNTDGIKTWGALRTDMNATLKNFWQTSFTSWVDFRGLSDDLTRGGPLMGTGQAWVVIGSLSNASAATTRWRARVYYGENELGEQTYRISGGLTLTPGPRWQLSVDPNYLRSINPRQYVTARDGGPEAAFGRRYIFSFIDRSTLLAQLRLNYTFTPDLSLELYAEPFAASGRAYDFGELSAARSRRLRFYGTDATTIEERDDGSRLVTDGADTFTLLDQDFNVRSLRSNVVLRWEWRRGSTLYLVWQQDRSGFEPQGKLVDPASLWETFEAEGDNRLAIKMSYWLPVP